MPKRTPYGSKIYSQIKDFQNFINEASKEQLLSLIKEDPNYLYYILPFTYSLGNTDILFEKFKDISFNPPTWWQSKTNFDFSTFSETILTNLINFENSIPFINYQEPTDNNSKEQENPINNSFNPEPENNSNTNQSNAATLNNTKEISPKKEPTQNKFIKAFLKIWNLSSYIELIIFIPLILIGIFLTTSNSYLLITEYLSSKNYLKTEGKLTKFTDCENEAEFGNTCKGIYEYQVNGKTYQASPKILTNTSNFKKTATVKYNPSNPQESIIYPPVISLIIAGLLLTILPLCFFFYTKKKSKDFFSQLDGSIKPSNKKAISKLK